MGDGPAQCGPVAELLRPELLERAFSVARATLERHLAGDSPTLI
jgi:hypothetical protein